MDVGVLDLQIRDNSAQAYDGLNKVATALERIQAAVSSARSLTSVAKAINEINAAVSNAIPDKSITNLERLADVIKKINEAGGIKLNGLKKAIKDMNAAETAQQTGKQIEDAIVGSFQRVESRAHEFSENLGRSVGDAANEALRRVFNQDYGSGLFKRFNPQTGMFENMPGIRTMKEFNEYMDGINGTGPMEQMAGSAANAANQMERMRDLVADTRWQAGDMAEKFAQMFQYWSAMRSSRALGPGDNEYYDRMRMKAEAIPAEGSVSGDFKRLAAGIEEAGNSAPAATGQLKSLDRELRQKKTDAMGAASGFENLKERIVEAEPAASGLSGLFGRLGEEFANLRAGIQTLFAPLTGLLKQFWRLAKMRMMRYVIREIAKGFSEGVQNVYHYSKAIGGSFAPAMDSAASALQKFKNSVGAAVAPLLQALIPAINSVISAVIRALNVLNQFFALITGQSSWTMAVDTTAEAWADTAASTGSAAHNIKEAKDLLADWDELNIIQSDPGDNGGGGGGGGGKPGKDYSKMFETIDKFNEKLQAFVEMINEQFGSVMDFVKRIGMLIAAWKVSAAFEGIISTLAGLMGIGLAIDLTFELSHMFALEYLQDGDVGWLIMDALTGVLGTVLAYKIAKLIGGQGFAEYTIPITLLFAAVANLIANLESVDVDALSEKSINVSLLSALEAGGAFGYLYYLGGMSAGQATVIGAGAAMIWFGISIGLKATVQSINTDGLDRKTIEADIVAALTTGTGLAIMELGAGGTAASALALGGGAALITLTAFVGIQAFAQAVKSDVTAEKVKYTALSSLSLGVGGAMFAKLAGASLLAAVGWGAAAAVATVGAVILVSAILTTDKHHIEWGNVDLSEKEIQAFVTDKMFKFPLPAYLELDAQTVEVTENERRKIEGMITNVEVTLRSVVIGIDRATSLLQLDKDINGEEGLIAEFKALNQAKKREIEVAFTVVPVKDEKGNDVTARFSGALTEGWSALESIMTGIGQELAGAIQKAYQAELNGVTDQMALNTITELTQTMAEVQGILTSSNATVTVTRNYKEGLTNLSDKSFKGILAFYQQQTSEARAFMEAEFEKPLFELQRNEMAFLALAEKAKENGGEFAGYTTEYYQSMADAAHDAYTEMESLKETSIQQAMDFYTNGEGLGMVREAVLGMLQGGKIGSVFDSLSSEQIKGFIFGWDAFGGFNNEFSSEFEQGIRSMLREVIESEHATDAEFLLGLIDEGILGYGDLISGAIVNELVNNLGLDEDQRIELERVLRDVYGIEIPQEVEEQIEQQQPEIQTETVVEPEVVAEPRVSVIGNISDMIDSAMTDVEGGYKTAWTDSPLESELSEYFSSLMPDTGFGSLTGIPEAVRDDLNDTDQAIREHQAPEVTPPNTEPFDKGMSGLKDRTVAACSEIRSAVMSLSGLGASFSASFNASIDPYYHYPMSNGGSAGNNKITQRAAGGFIRSGDLVMANENGNIEYMGKMGHNPAVANNEQIVEGISRGVSQSNGDLVTAMNTLIGIARQMASKDMVAKVVPSASIGRSNRQSELAYHKISG